MAKSAAVVGGGNGAINFEASFESWSSQQKPRFTKRVSPAAASAAAESSSTSGGGGSPFVVDIGSWRTRAGFACSPGKAFSPRPGHT